MSQYGITATNLADSHAAAMARNLYSAGITLLNTQFSGISNYYYDLAIEYAGGGLLTMTRVWIQNPPTEAAQIHISNDGSAPSGTLGNQFDLVPTQYATQAPYTSIGIKRATVRQAIVEGSVEWIVDGYQTESYSTVSQTGFYVSSRDDAELTIVQSTIPVTFNNDTPWIFQTWLDTPLLNYSPPQSFLDGLDKPTNYYLSFYLVNNNGTASGAERIYFKEDPGTIHVRTYYSSGSFYNGWYLSWELPDDNNGAWNFNLSNQNGASPDWSMTGGSGGWYHKMWEYDSSNPANHGYNIQSPYWLFIFESTVPINYAGNEIEPPDPGTGIADYLFTRRNFTLNFGIRTNSSSPKWEGYTNESSPAKPHEEGDLNYYYYTPACSPVLRFTSPVDNIEYSVPVIELASYRGSNFGFFAPNYKVTDSSSNYTLSTYASGHTREKYIQSFRALLGNYTKEQLEEAAYSDMIEIGTNRNGNTWVQDRQGWTGAISLEEIIYYFNATHPNFGPNDVYTTLYMDFYDWDLYSETRGMLLATREVDLSSLYNSGIDPRKDDDEGDSDSQKEDDKSNPEYNPNETKDIPMNIPILSPYNLFNRTYALSPPEVEKLGDLISTTDDSIMNAILAGLLMFGDKPMDALIDLRLYPFDVATVEASGGSLAAAEYIMLGRHLSNVKGVPISGRYCSIDLGSFYIQPKFDSFLDFEPHTAINLYIPYIGTVALKPSLFMDKLVSVKLVVDFITGAATAVIYGDKIPMMYQSGVIGVSIAMTGDDAAAYANGVLGNLIGTIGSAAKALVGPGGLSNGGNIAKAGISAVSGLYDFLCSTQEVDFQQAGSTSPAIGNWLPQKCHIMVARPQMNFETPDDMELFGETVGFATSYSCRIMDLADHGIYYGVLAEHMGAGGATEPIPTAKEIDLMKEALNNGFFIT